MGSRGKGRGKKQNKKEWENDTEEEGRQFHVIVLHVPHEMLQTVLSLKYPLRRMKKLFDKIVLTDLTIALEMRTFQISSLY